MAAGGGLVFIAFLFFLHGLHAAATEGLAKAWIAEVTDAHGTATAIGTFAGFQSICALLASSLAGVLWFAFGPVATFAVTGGMAVIVLLYMSAATLGRNA